jgi:hypothetical protein
MVVVDRKEWLTPDTLYLKAQISSNMLAEIQKDGIASFVQIPINGISVRNWINSPAKIGRRIAYRLDGLRIDKRG